MKRNKQNVVSTVLNISTSPWGQKSGEIHTKGIMGNFCFLSIYQCLKSLQWIFWLFLWSGKKKTRKNPCFQICLKNKKLLIWKPQRSVNFSISAEHLLVRPFQLFTCYRTFFSFTVSSSFFYKCCLWIPSKSFPVVLQAIFFFWINFFQKVNSKLALPTLQIPPGWTNK